MTLNTFSSGVNTSFSTQLNTNFNSSIVNQVSTTTALDITLANSSTSNTVELSSISSANLAGADYVVIKFTGVCQGDSNANAGASVSLQLESKEIGGGYSDTLPTTTIFSTSADTVGETRGSTFEWIHTLTAGEKSNGVQFRVTVATTVGGTSQAGFTLKQIYLKLSA